MALVPPRIVGTLSVGAFSATVASPHAESLELTDTVTENDMVFIFDISFNEQTNFGVHAEYNVPVHLQANAKYRETQPIVNSMLSIVAPSPAIDDAQVGGTFGAIPSTGETLSPGEAIDIEWRPVPVGGGELLTAESASVIALAIPRARRWNPTCVEGNDLNTDYNSDLAFSTNFTDALPLVTPATIFVPAGDRFFTLASECALSGALVTVYGNAAVDGTLDVDVAETLIGQHEGIVVTWKDYSGSLPSDVLDVDATGTWIAGGRHSAVALLYITTVAGPGIYLAPRIVG